MKNPVHYGLCRQTVTVYREKGGTIEKTVIPGAFLELRRNRKTDRIGIQEHTGFLLVIPGQTQAVFVGDKVIHGEGKDLSRQEWSALTDCCIVRWAEQKFWDGRPVHTEAGA